MPYTRFAVFYVPPAGDLAQFGSRWLGWDLILGRAVAPFDVEGRDAITETPRKYGLHGTIKPPFALANGSTPAQLAQAVADLATNLAPVRCDGLALHPLGRFLALTPVGDTAALAALAFGCVRALDQFRAPASPSELARRRAAGLTPSQEANLVRWGYPFVDQDFRFHLTLTGKVQKPSLDHWMQVVGDLMPPLPRPFTIDSLAVVGERSDGRFELIQRYDLTG